MTVKTDEVMIIDHQNAHLSLSLSLLILQACVGCVSNNHSGASLTYSTCVVNAVVIALCLSLTMMGSGLYLYT
jgi:hypothetical protein